MCGIAGLFLPTAAPHARADMDAMLRVMTHRGPDGDKRLATADGRFQLGFGRLAIIDLETGDQPIEDADGGRVLAGIIEAGGGERNGSTAHDGVVSRAGPASSVTLAVRAACDDESA